MRGDGVDTGRASFVPRARVRGYSRVRRRTGAPVPGRDICLAVYDCQLTLADDAAWLALANTPGSQQPGSAGIRPQVGGPERPVFTNTTRRCLQPITSRPWRRMVRT